MMDSRWVLVISLSLVAFLLRGSFLVFASKLELPKALDPILRYVPVAILASLVGPAFIKNEGVIDYSFSNPYLLAGLLATLVAWRSKSILITLIVGMVCLWFFQWLLSA